MRAAACGLVAINGGGAAWKTMNKVIHAAKYVDQRTILKTSRQVPCFGGVSDGSPRIGARLGGIGLLLRARIQMDARSYFTLLNAKTEERIAQQNTRLGAT